MIVADWDDVTRLQNRGQLSWLVQQLAEARRVAEQACGDPDASLVDLVEVLDVAVPPQVRCHSPDGTESFLAVARHAQHEIAQLTRAATRFRYKVLAALAVDLAAAAEALHLACDDFSGADVRAADLSYAYLGGICWTSDTRWPTSWAARIRAASTHSEDVYQIKDS
ncbi:hypothetical protein ACFYMW_25740 [Streptomyces sp. NPDC006692]|uniref:hypothetical protein n=1 Tax=unclassified Streptomyces TaxID=2593676 RepID=UPI003429397E